MLYVPGTGTGFFVAYYDDVILPFFPRHLSFSYSTFRKRNNPRFPTLFVALSPLFDTPFRLLNFLPILWRVACVQCLSVCIYLVKEVIYNQVVRGNY
jgi:hypothetical protein